MPPYLRIICGNRKPSSSRNSPEALLVDFQGSNLRFQRGSRYAQLGGRPGGSEHAAAALFQGRLNHAFLLGVEGLRELGGISRMCEKRLLRQPAFIDRENLRVAKDYGTLDDVL